jgi:hypothetical protein
MGPSLLIASRLVLAIRTARWAPRCDPSLSEQDLNIEIDFAAQVSHRVPRRLMAKFETLFPQRKEPSYQANDEDVHK